MNSDKVIEDLANEDLARLPYTDTHDFFENQPIYNKLSIQQSTMNTNTMENKMENKMENIEALFKRMDKKIADLKEVKELFESTIDTYKRFVFYYHGKYMEFHEKKITLEDFAAILNKGAPDPADYEDVLKYMQKDESFVRVLEGAKPPAHIRFTSAIKKQVIQAVGAGDKYMEPFVEWCLRDYTPEDERPMVECVICDKPFPYGSADGICDECQLFARTYAIKQRKEKWIIDVDNLKKMANDYSTNMFFEVAWNEGFSLGERITASCLSITKEDWLGVIEEIEELVKDFSPTSVEPITKLTIPREIVSWADLIKTYVAMFLLKDKEVPLISEAEGIRQKEMEARRISGKQKELEEEAKKEAEKEAKKLAKKAEEEAKKLAAKEKSKSAFNPPEYPPAQKIKCKGSAQMISNAPAQRAWLEKWAKDAWNGKDLWSAKTAKQYVADKKNGVGTIFATAVVIEAVIFDGVEAEPIED